MSPDPPPSSSDGQSLPPRHRPTLDKLSKDTTEMNLWSLEDDLDLGDPPARGSNIPPPRSSGNEIPAPREQRVAKERGPVKSVKPAAPPPGGERIQMNATELNLWSFEDDLDPSAAPPVRNSGNDIPVPRGRRTIKEREPVNPLDPPPPPDGGERILMNISTSRLRGQSGVPGMVPSRAGSEVEDAEYWDDMPKGPQIDDLPPEPEALVESTVSESLESPAGQADNPDSPKIEVEDDEFSPKKRSDAKPLSLKPHLRFSKVEHMGLIVLVGLLALGGIATIVFSLNRLPTTSAQTKNNKFPIKGTMLVVNSASSYWREPITDGSAPEIVRRGTKLLPVLELEVREGTGAIRVLFRDEERTAVGDAVTHAVRGAGTLVIPATAGFDDVGMHAAYRTGGSKPWTIEVFEAASETTTGKDFKKLFEMNISTDRR